MSAPGSTRPRSRSRSRSASPGIIVNEEMGPIARNAYRFRVKCMNGEVHTSQYEYTRIAARDAARAYCSLRGGVDGRIEYDMIYL